MTKQELIDSLTLCADAIDNYRNVLTLVSHAEKCYSRITDRLGVDILSDMQKLAHKITREAATENLEKLLVEREQLKHDLRILESLENLSKNPQS